MNILLDVCLGVFGTWAFKNLKKESIIKRIIGIVLLIMLVVSVAVYRLENNYVVDIIVIFAFFALTCVFYSRIEGVLGILIEKYKVSSCIKKVSEPDIFDEDDFMKTKLGRIMTVVCVLLVIYMFASAVCIYKLNAKINSVYDITQELREEK